MAGLTREQRAMREAAKQDAKQVEQQPDPSARHDDGLVEMSKDEETTRVHPTCVKSHRDAGWRLT